MVKYRIENKNKELTINIENITENKEKILQNFNQCKAGKCSCPTNQYSKIENLDISIGEEKIIMKLKPKNGENFNKKEIEKCLEFTIENV